MENPDYGELVGKILEHVGGRENVTSITNCMTRLRINVKDDRKIDDQALKSVEGVLGIVHDRPKYVEAVVGPGTSSKCGALVRQMGIPAADPDWKENKKAAEAEQKHSRIRSALKIFGEIFVPLIPGVIASGLCAGINTLIQQLYPGWAGNPLTNVICSMLGLINASFLTYLTAWTGYRAAERFGGTPILGGMLGMVTGLDGINTIAQTIGWWNESSPLSSTLHSGRGGILAVVFGVLLMAEAEKWIRKRMPGALDAVFTPLLTLVACLIPYIFVIMPLLGLISGWICLAVENVCMSPHLWVRAITGYVSAALFLPLVSMGMHHGLVALYTVQLEKMGYITLYPALCMAGAGQVGAAIAIYRKAKKVNNERLTHVISGALPAGILGVGEPLIYGVTLPMGRPFITAGLGAGFGGAFVMAMQVAATTWGPSGLLGIFTMTAGPGAGVMSVLYYLTGLVVSCIMAFLITAVFVTEDEVMSA
ncbi:MAG: PTS transporter subunit EIIC [Eubacteriales bacterium]|nr:PTS transporter subunit EIIC [Eubacteriales bacterium]